LIKKEHFEDECKKSCSFARDDLAGFAIATAAAERRAEASLRNVRVAQRLLPIKMANKPSPIRHSEIYP
jgi:hypothetical protein